MTVKKDLKIQREETNNYRKMMEANELDYEQNDIPRYSTVESWTVNFGNGYEMDLKVCSGNDSEPLWCEAVLFKNGCEVECSEVYDDLIGDWILCDGGDTFVLSVSTIG